MVKLLAVALYAYKGQDADPVCLGLATDLSGFGYFQRRHVREMLAFTARTIVQRTQPGQRLRVKQEDYYCHTHLQGSGMAGMAITDHDYPPTAAFCVLRKTMEEFMS